MKRILVILAIMAYKTSVKSQITVNNDVVYPIGMDKNIYVYNDFFLNNPILVNDIVSGPNVEWNFSNLTPDFSRNLKVVTTESAPYGNALPGNRVILMNDGEVDSQYLNFTNTQISSRGNIDGSGIQSITTPGEVLLKFPATYNQSEQSNFTNSIQFYVGTPLQTPYVVDSVRTVSTTDLNYVIDGWGKLTTPEGTFDVLRQNVYKKTVSVSDYLREDTKKWVLGAETNTVEERYFVFWSRDQNLPVLQLRDIGNGGYINDIYWLANPTLSNDDLATNKFSISPNPFVDEFAIYINDIPEAVVEVFESSGRKIKSVKINSGVSQINLSDFQSGMYLVNVKTNDNAHTYKLIKK